MQSVYVCNMMTRGLIKVGRVSCLQFIFYGPSVSALTDLWSDEGVVVHLVDSQWTLLGDKAIHRIKLVHFTQQDKLMLLSNLVPGYILIDRSVV